MDYDPGQKNAVNICLQGDDLNIEAYAGTGKTTTNMRFASKSKGKKGLILTYNKSMSDDNRKKAPSNFECMTPHSLSFEHVGIDYVDRIENSFSSSKLKKNLSLSDFKLSNFQENQMLISSMNKFCSISDKQFNPDIIQTNHIRNLKNDKDLKELKNIVSDHFNNLWYEMVDLNSTIPITHDFYLKLYCLQESQLDKDVIILDEAQDSSPVIIDFFESQHCQKIKSGDSHQAIYSWRNCINGMSEGNIKNKAYLRQSFRFGKEIAIAANYVLNVHNDVEKVNIIGNPAIDSQINLKIKPDAIIYRNVLDMVDELFWSINRGYTPYVKGGISELYQKIKFVYELKCHKVSFGKFHHYNEFKEHLDNIKSGKWITIRKLLQIYTIESLAKIIYPVFFTKEEESNVLIISAHKSKGLQFPHVKISNGFISPNNKKWTVEEGNLLYVAITRAVLSLNIENCDAFEY